MTRAALAYLAAIAAGALAGRAVAWWQTERLLRDASAAQSSTWRTNSADVGDRMGGERQ